ncbi:hypothetical protein TNCV_1370341 [Trichonephila clavipes]|nr:hypothetical protein TNCV_1370341 [Trichonephila clavipes]
MAKETRNTCELKTPFQTTTPRQQVYEPRKLIKHKPLYRVVLKWHMSHNTDYNSSGFWEKNAVSDEKSLTTIYKKDNYSLNNSESGSRAEEDTSARTLCANYNTSPTGGPCKD